MPKVFLTGGTGFIGGNLVGKLLDKGFDVKVLVRNVGAYRGMSWKNKVEIISGDILEPKSFEDKISDCEIVIHSAAAILWWNRIWDEIYKINVIGTKNVLDAAIKNKCKKFVHISSVAAIGYGENGEVINETHEYNWGKHNIVYMETKHEAELEVRKAINCGLNATIVNPANVWGVGDYKGRRAKIIRVLKSGFPFYISGGTCFVDVDAVCEGIINAITLGKCGERYILGGENLTIKKFLDTICEEIGQTWKPFIKITEHPIILYAYLQEALSLVTNKSPKPTASQIPLFGKFVCYDSSKAIRELKMPFIPFKECLHKTVDFYREQNLL